MSITRLRHDVSQARAQSPVELREELARKDREILSLKNEVARLTVENEMLRLQLGSSSSNQPAAGSRAAVTPISPAPVAAASSGGQASSNIARRAHASLPFDFEALEASIKLINETVAEHNPDTTPPQLPVTLYSEGFTLATSPFLSYVSQSGRRVLDDLLAGYMPALLRTEYPTGGLLFIRDEVVSSAAAASAAPPLSAATPTTPVRTPTSTTGGRTPRRGRGSRGGRGTPTPRTATLRPLTATGTPLSATSRPATSSTGASYYRDPATTHTLSSPVSQGLGVTVQGLRAGPRGGSAVAGGAGRFTGGRAGAASAAPSASDAVGGSANASVDAVAEPQPLPEGSPFGPAPADAPVRTVAFGGRVILPSGEGVADATVLVGSQTLRSGEGGKFSTTVTLRGQSVNLKVVPTGSLLAPPERLVYVGTEDVDNALVVVSEPVEEGVVKFYTTWGRSGIDCDSSMWTSWGKKVYYGDPESERAECKVVHGGDVREGGPEVITVTDKDGKRRYQHRVGMWGGNDELLKTLMFADCAVVAVSHDAIAQLSSSDVVTPTDSEDLRWRTFDVVDGQIVIVNCLESNSEVDDEDELLRKFKASGRVVNALTGEGMANVVVKVAGRHPYAEALSRGDGTFEVEFTGVPDRHITLQPSDLSGYVSTPARRIGNPQRTADEGVVALLPTMLPLCPSGSGTFGHHGMNALFVVCPEKVPPPVVAEGEDASSYKWDSVVVTSWGGRHTNSFTASGPQIERGMSYVRGCVSWPFLSTLMKEGGDTRSGRKRTFTTYVHGPEEGGDAEVYMFTKEGAANAPVSLGKDSISMQSFSVQGGVAKEVWNFEDPPAELDDEDTADREVEVSGRVVNALSAEGIVGARVRIADKSCLTDSSGNYKIAVRGARGVDLYVAAEVSGYEVPPPRPVRVPVSGNKKAIEDVNMAVCPALADGEVVFVTVWGRGRGDVDAHVQTSWGETVSYSNRKTERGDAVCEHTTGDSYSGGPESIRCYETSSQRTFRHYVCSYAAGWKNVGVRVYAYTKDGVREMVCDGNRAGADDSDVWQSFIAQGGKVTTVDSFAAVPEGSDEDPPRRHAFVGVAVNGIDNSPLSNVMVDVLGATTATQSDGTFRVVVDTVKGDWAPISYSRDGYVAPTSRLVPAPTDVSTTEDIRLVLVPQADEDTQAARRVVIATQWRGDNDLDAKLVTSWGETVSYSNTEAARGNAKAELTTGDSYEGKSVETMVCTDGDGKRTYKHYVYLQSGDSLKGSGLVVTYVDRYNNASVMTLRGERQVPEGGEWWHTVDVRDGSVHVVNAFDAPDSETKDEDELARRFLVTGRVCHAVTGVGLAGIRLKVGDEFVTSRTDGRYSIEVSRIADRKLRVEVTDAAGYLHPPVRQVPVPATGAAETISDGQECLPDVDFVLCPSSAARGVYDGAVFVVDGAGYGINATKPSLGAGYSSVVVSSWGGRLEVPKGARAPGSVARAESSMAAGCTTGPVVAICKDGGEGAIGARIFSHYVRVPGSRSANGELPELSVQTRGLTVFAMVPGGDTEMITSDNVGAMEWWHTFDVSNGVVTVVNRAEAPPAELDDEDVRSRDVVLTGRVANATTAEGIIGARVHVSGSSTVTDSEGRFSLPMRAIRGEDVHVRAEVGGYQVPPPRPIAIPARGHDREIKNVNVFVCPRVAPNEAVFVTLWGEGTGDCDAHVQTSWGQTVDYADQRSERDGASAEHTTGDSYSGGPETIRCKDPTGQRTFRHYVRTYNGDWWRTRLRVYAYTHDAVKELAVSTTAASETPYWKTFTLRGDKLFTVDQYVEEISDAVNEDDAPTVVTVRGVVCGPAEAERLPNVPVVAQLDGSSFGPFMTDTQGLFTGTIDVRGEGEVMFSAVVGGCVVPNARYAVSRETSDIDPVSLFAVRTQLDFTRVWVRSTNGVRRLNAAVVTSWGATVTAGEPSSQHSMASCTYTGTPLYPSFDLKDLTKRNSFNLYVTLDSDAAEITLSEARPQVVILDTSDNVHTVSLRPDADTPVGATWHVADVVNGVVEVVDKLEGPPNVSLDNTELTKRYTLSGRCINAVTGAGVVFARVFCGSSSTVTGMNGRFNLTATGLPGPSAEIRATANGFATSPTIPVSFDASTLSATDVDVYVVPQVQSGSSYFVVQWAGTQRAVDAHVVTSWGEKVFYGTPYVTRGTADARLIQDSRDGSGPQTIVASDPGGARVFSHYVRAYDTAASVADTTPRVTVFTSGASMSMVCDLSAAGGSDAKWWHTYDVVGGEVRVVNRLEAPPSVLDDEDVKARLHRVNGVVRNAFSAQPMVGVPVQVASGNGTVTVMSGDTGVYSAALQASRDEEVMVAPRVGGYTAPSKFSFLAPKRGEAVLSDADVFVVPPVPRGSTMLVATWGGGADLEANLTTSWGAHINPSGPHAYAHEAAATVAASAESGTMDSVMVSDPNRQRTFSHYLKLRSGTSFASSAARVCVFQPFGQVAEVAMKTSWIPDGATWWHTFDVVKGEVIAVNTFEGPPSPVPDNDTHLPPPSAADRAPGVGAGASSVAADLERASLFREAATDAFRARDFEKAVELYTRAIEVAPSAMLPPLLSSRVAALCELGRPYEALEDAVRCTELAPVWGKGWLRRGAVLRQLGRERDAIQIFEQGLAVAVDGLGQLRDALRDTLNSATSSPPRGRSSPQPPLFSTVRSSSPVSATVTRGAATVRGFNGNDLASSIPAVPSTPASLRGSTRSATGGSQLPVLISSTESSGVPVIVEAVTPANSLYSSQRGDLPIVTFTIRVKGTVVASGADGGRPIVMVVRVFRSNTLKDVHDYIERTAADALGVTITRDNAALHLMRESGEEGAQIPYESTSIEAVGLDNAVGAYLIYTPAE